jgi:hypothetical protein
MRLGNVMFQALTVSNDISFMQTFGSVVGGYIPLSGLLGGGVKVRHHLKGAAIQFSKWFNVLSIIDWLIIYCFIPAQGLITFI